MHPIPVDYTTTLELTVTKQMTIGFEQTGRRLSKLHGIYAPNYLIEHLGLVSHKLIAPYLEPDEEGIITEVQVRHLAPTLPGMKVRFSAQHTETRHTFIYLTCEVHNILGDKIATAQTTQVFLKKQALNDSFVTLKDRWEAYRD
jgi:fluoroacetyl-CoA thioesterase